VWNNQYEDDPSLDELRRMLVDKRRKVRQERLERFRKTGRVVRLASDISTTPLEGLASDSIPDSQEIKSIKQKKGKRRRILDTILLLIEVGAVISLLILMLSGAQMLRNLNMEVSEVLELPTLTPTPMIVAMVLPSGHTSPNSANGAAPNNAEIPEHLRPLIQTLSNIPIPTPGPEQANRIQIPAIKIDAPIVQGDGWEQLKKGVAQHIGSANPGESSNIVLAAHNDVFGEIFRDLDRLKPGDQVIIFTQKRSYTYIVSTTEIVEPTRVDLMSATTQPVVTLISCYPYLVDNKRIVVRAALQSSTK
jgi:sortase A